MTSSSTKINFSESFCLRTPLLSLDFLLSLLGQQSLSDVQLTKLWSMPLIKEMIWIASPSLYESLEGYERGIIKSEKRREGIKKSFLRYLIRSSSRCTPFGLCAGVSMGILSSEDRVSLDISQFHRRTRLDNHYLDLIFKKINTEDRRHTDLRYYINTSLYSIGSDHRFIKYAYDTSKKSRAYYITGINRSDIVEKVISYINDGKKRTEIELFIESLGIDKQQSQGIFDKMLDNQLIISDLDLSVLGQDNLTRAVEVLRSTAINSLYYPGLSKINEQLKELDKTLTPSLESKLSLIDDIDKLKITYDPRLLFQCDLYTKTATSTINKKYAYKIGRLIKKLSLCQEHRENSRLAAFKRAFSKRYETQEKPLSLALDVDTGIGYVQDKRTSNTTTYLDEIKAVSQGKEVVISNREIGSFASSIVQQVTRALQHQAQSVQINLDSFSIKDNLHLLKGTTSAMIEIVEVDREQKIYIKNLGGSTSAALLGRFAYGSLEIANAVNNICTYEQGAEKEALLAEIHHVPDSRTGNILYRPNIRDYELTYLAHKKSLKNTITIDDLYVSVRQNRVLLRSRSLNREVIPMLSNAHNYRIATLPIYQFLCDLSSQSKRVQFAPDFDTLFSNFFFTPRILIDDIILSKATWRLTLDLFSDVQAKDKSDRNSKIRRLLSGYKIPDYIQLVQRDNLLTLNLQNDDCIDILYESLRNRKAITIQEYLRCAPIVKDDTEDSYAHEFVISYKFEQHDS